MCCPETDNTGSEKLLKQIERIMNCMGRSSILLKQHSALLVDSEPLTKFSVELVDDFTVWSEKTMHGVECDPCSHFGALYMFSFTS